MFFQDQTDAFLQSQSRKLASEEQTLQQRNVFKEILVWDKINIDQTFEMHRPLAFEATIQNQIMQFANQININHLTSNAKSHSYKVQFMTKEHFCKVQFQMKNYSHGHMECKVTISRNYVKCKAVLCYKTLKGNQTHGYMYIYEISD